MNAKDQGAKAAKNPRIPSPFLDVSIHPAKPKGSGTMTNRHGPNDPQPRVKEEPTGPVRFHRIGRRSPPFQEPRKPGVVLEGHQGRVVLHKFEIVKAQPQCLGEQFQSLFLVAKGGVEAT